MGYKLIHVVPGNKTFTSDLKVSGTTIENANLRVTVDPTTGCITCLFNKKANFETLAPNSCGNELQAFKDTPKEYDAWNIDPGTLDQPPTLLHQVDSVKVVESGPMRAGIRVSPHLAELQIRPGNLPRRRTPIEVLVTNDIDWHETHVLLKAAFPLAATSDNATYEIPYGTIQRPTTRNNSWEKAKFEVPAMRWADLGDAKQGMSLINESKYGYDAAGNVLRLTLLRSPVWPDPDADRGHHHFVFALYPHAGDWKQAMSMRHGYELNYGLKAMQVDQHTGDWPAEHSFVGIDGDNVVLTAIKKAENADGLVFRFFEWEGKVRQHNPPRPRGSDLRNHHQPDGNPRRLAALRHQQSSDCSSHAVSRSRRCGWTTTQRLPSVKKSRPLITRQLLALTNFLKVIYTSYIRGE